MKRRTAEYTFDERGLPTLRRTWDWTVPDLGEIERSPSGARPHAELERIIDAACKFILVAHLEGLATIETVAAHAEALDLGDPISPGQVWTVLRNWERDGYALVDTHPRRFVGFTAHGMREGLAEHRRQLKRRKRREQERTHRSGGW